MFDLFLKPKFYSKSKSALRVLKVRLETIKKKRNAVEKYLKKDIADLLKNSLDYNAYGRTEGLLVEQTRTACYKFIEHFSECISKHLSVMQKQSECPEECREAVPSLIYAAARFSDLPELRTLRMLFTERYGDSLEPYLNQEFVEKIRAEPPTKEMKLRLMRSIAKEFSIQWDSKALEQKLFTPPPPEQDEVRHKSLNEGDGEGYESRRRKNDTNETDHAPCTKKEVLDDKPKRHSRRYVNECAFDDSNDRDENGSSYLQEYMRSNRNENGLTSRASKEGAFDNSNNHDENGSSYVQKYMGSNRHENGLTSRASKEGAFDNSNNHDENGSSYVQKYMGSNRNEKGLTSRASKEGAFDNSNNHDENGSSCLQEYTMSNRNEKGLTSRASKEGESTDRASVPDDVKENNKPFYYRFVPPPYVKSPVDISNEQSSTEEPETPSRNINKEKIDTSKPIPRSVRSRRPLKLPPGRENTAKSDPSSPPVSVLSFPNGVVGRNIQASSFERDIFVESVPRKLPDYDSLVTRLGAQRGKRN